MTRGVTCSVVRMRHGAASLRSPVVRTVAGKYPASVVRMSCADLASLAAWPGVRRAGLRGRAGR
jgi:hypothetical protein